MNLKELVFTDGHGVVLTNIDDGDAVYHLIDGSNAVLLQFRIPREDLRGAVFNRIDTPKMFMRWIRKELQRQDEERAMIEQAKKDWEEGKQS